MFILFYVTIWPHWVNTLGPRQNERHFADDIFKCIFLNENIWISIKISLKFVPKGPINNIPALVQIMAWRRPGDKPLSEAMMVNLATHICVSRPQWVHSQQHTVSRNIHNLRSLAQVYQTVTTKSPVHGLRLTKQVRPINLLYIIMFKISKIKPNSSSVW